MVRKIWQLKNRRGATLAVVAVSLVALLSIMALAIDMGMMYSARNEAQRVADAAALAGASAFIDPTYTTPASAVTPAFNRALEYVKLNSVLATMVDSAEAEINVNPNTRRVKVTVRRARIGTWFARMFGVDTVAVRASATAEATNAGNSAPCVKPWALQDLWFEDDGVRPALDDKFAGQPEEAPNYPSDCRTAGVDCYKPALTLGDPSASGYGRDASDNGMPITIKTQRPTTGGDDEIYQPGPGEFMIWDMPVDSAMGQCAEQGGDDVASPAYVYRNSICGCNNNSFNIGDTITDPRNASQDAWKTGNTVGPTAQGIDALFEIAEATPGVGKMDWQQFETWSQTHDPVSHPQVVKMGLIEPLPPPDGPNWTSSNMPPLVFRNFVLVFVEDYIVHRSDQQVEIVGRFMYTAPGDEGPVQGSLTRYLRLVE